MTTNDRCSQRSFVVRDLGLSAVDRQPGERIIRTQFEAIGQQNFA